MKINKNFSILFLLFLLIFPSFFISKIEFDNSAVSYLPRHKDYVDQYYKIRKLFGSDEAFILVFENEHLFESDFLSRLNQFDEDISKNKLTHRTYSVFNVELTESDEDSIKISPIINPEEINEQPPEYFENRIKKSSLAEGLVVSKDHKHLAITVLGKNKINTVEARELYIEIKKIAQKFHLTENLKYIAGSMATDVRSFETSFFDLAKFIPLTVATGFFLIWFFFPGFLPVALAMVTINAISGLLMSLFPLFGVTFNIISTMVPTLMMALGVAFIIHLYNALKLYSKKENDITQITYKAIEHIKKPSFYTAITTAVGFCSLAMSEIPPIKHFAFISAFGVMLIYYVVIYIIPPILIWRKEHDWSHSRELSLVIDKFVMLLFRISVRYSKLVIIAFLLSFIISIPLIQKIKVETSLLKFFKDDHIANTDTNKVQEILTGTGFIELYFKSKDPTITKDPDTIKKIWDFQKLSEKHPYIDRNLSFVDYIKEIHKAFNPNDNDLPKDKRAISDYLETYDGQDMYDLIDEFYNEGRIQFNLNVHEASNISKVIEHLRQEFTKLQLPFEFEFSGISSLFAKQEVLMVQGQIKSLWVSILVIFILMLIQWKSVKNAILTMIPNIGPLIIIFSFMGLFGIWLDMGTALIASVTIGIAVDDTIHLFSNFSGHKSKNVIFALAKTYHESGRAITLTSIILCSQFIILTLSSYIPTGRFGLLTSIGLVFALFADLTLLPAILHLIYRKKESL